MYTLCFGKHPLHSGLIQIHILAGIEQVVQAKEKSLALDSNGMLPHFAGFNVQYIANTSGDHQAVNRIDGVCLGWLMF